MKVSNFSTQENQYNKTMKKKPQNNLVTKSHINQLVINRK